MYYVDLATVNFVFSLNLQCSLMTIFNFTLLFILFSKTIIFTCVLIFIVQSTYRVNIECLTLCVSDCSEHALRMIS